MELSELFGKDGKDEAPDPHDSEEDLSDEEHGAAKDDAMKNFMAGHKMGDHAAMRKALESFMDLHKKGDGDEATHEDDGHVGEHDEDDLKM